MICQLITLDTYIGLKAKNLPTVNDKTNEGKLSMNYKFTLVVSLPYLRVNVA